MEIKLYNSLTNKIEVFNTIKENEVSMYVCGPTVYNDPHIGNIRPVVFFDTLRRFLEKCGYKVTYVSNFTDVDDKIINRALNLGISEKELTDKYIEEYLRLIDSLHVKRANVYPRVTEYMDKIIDYINDLVKNGSAYVKDGEVFFDVLADKKYGELSKISIEDLNNGARIEINNKKKSPLDFLLWKNTSVGVKWDSPWGEGRPGWHTECCVMINSIFGNIIDIHGGGSDLKFPHHENEIAQSELHSDTHLANFWVHNAMMDIDGTKMSKSLGNVILAKDAINNYGANLVRLLLINAPYRSIIDFNDETIKNNESILKKLEAAIKQARLFLSLNHFNSNYDKKLLEPFLECLADDMNIPNGITYLLDLIKHLNQELRNKEKNIDAINNYYFVIKDICEILGISFNFDELLFDDINLYKSYEEAKFSKNFALSDQIRNELIKKNIL